MVALTALPAAVGSPAFPGTVMPWTLDFLVYEPDRKSGEGEGLPSGWVPLCDGDPSARTAMNIHFKHTQLT